MGEQHSARNGQTVRLDTDPGDQIYRTIRSVVFDPTSIYVVIHKGWDRFDAASQNMPCLGILETFMMSKSWRAEQRLIAITT